MNNFHIFSYKNPPQKVSQLLWHFALLKRDAIVVWWMRVKSNVFVVCVCECVVFFLNRRIHCTNTKQLLLHSQFPIAMRVAWLFDLSIFVCFVRLPFDPAMPVSMSSMDDVNWSQFFSTTAVISTVLQFLTGTYVIGLHSFSSWYPLIVSLIPVPAWCATSTSRRRVLANHRASHSYADFCRKIYILILMWSIIIPCIRVF